MRTNIGKNSVRFGLVGYGNHGRCAVLPAINAAKGAKVAAVADLDPANLARLPDPSIPTYTDYRKMLQSEQLDAVYVAVPVEKHGVVTMAALQAGLHVIVEKPMAPTVAECRSMINAAKKNDLLLAVDFELRYSPIFIQIRKWISAGCLGRVGAIHFDHMWDGHKTTGDLAERRRRFCDSSGTLDCGIHRLDLMRYFIGGGTWKEVCAHGVWFNEKVRYAPHIAIQARLDNGVIATFNSSFAFTAYIKERASHTSLAIVGQKGVITMGTGADGKQVLRLVSEKQCETLPCAAESHAPSITLLVEDFSRAVLGGGPLPPEAASGEDGLMAVWIVDEANRIALVNGDTFKNH